MNIFSTYGGFFPGTSGRRKVWRPGFIVMSEKINVNGVRMDLLTRDEFSSRLKSFMNNDGLSTLTFVGKKAIDTAAGDSGYAEMLDSFSMAVPCDEDTAGDMNILNFNAKPVLGKDICGLMKDMRKDRKYSVFILADSKKKVRSIRNFFEKSKIKAAYRGTFIKCDEADDQKAVNDINASVPDITIVSVGSPEQEEWICRHAEMLNTRLCVAAGELGETCGNKKSRLRRLLDRRK